MRLNLKGMVMASLLGSLLALVGCDPQKIAKLEEKHFTGKRTGEHFRRHKSYRRTLYRLAA